MSRPRRVSDQQLLQAAYDLIMDQGLSKLTFSRLGERVGLVPAAIVKRFSSKKKLIAEIDRYALQRSMAAFNDTKERHDSPIESLIAGMVAELSFATSLTRFANGQSILLHDFMDPELYQNYRKSFNERQRQLMLLIKEAQERELLVKDADPLELAILLQTVQHGTGHMWAMSQQDSIKKYIERSVRLALRPYMITGNQYKERV